MNHTTFNPYPLNSERFTIIDWFTIIAAFLHFALAILIYPFALKAMMCQERRFCIWFYSGTFLLCLASIFFTTVLIVDLLPNRRSNDFEALFFDITWISLNIMCILSTLSSCLTGFHSTLRGVQGNISIYANIFATLSTLNYIVCTLALIGISALFVYMPCRSLEDFEFLFMLFLYSVARSLCIVVFIELFSAANIKNRHINALRTVRYIIPTSFCVLLCAFEFHNIYWLHFGSCEKLFPQRDPVDSIFGLGRGIMCVNVGAFWFVDFHLAWPLTATIKDYIKKKVKQEKRNKLRTLNGKQSIFSKIIECHDASAAEKKSLA